MGQDHGPGGLVKGGVGETLESPSQGWHGAGWAASTFLQTSDPTPPHSTVFLVDWVLLLDGHPAQLPPPFLEPRARAVG